METPPSLDGASLHLWKIPTAVAGGSSAEPLKELLSPQERARADRMRVSDPRERYIRAHAGLRRILAGYLCTEPQKVDFTYAPAGKPLLAGAGCTLEFNLTTSADLALLAISATLPVGIDCERVRDRTHLIDIAKRMFPPQIAESVATARRRDRLEHFHRAWTELEARVKEDGSGLLSGQGWATEALPVAHFVPAPGYLAAVARKNLPPVDDWATLQIRSDWS